MEITKEEIRAALLDAGLPQQLISEVEKVIEKEDLKKDYTAGFKLLQEQRAIIVYGPDSPLKDVICAKLMRRYMVKNGKTGRWLTPISIPQSTLEEIPGAGVIAIVGVDLLHPTQARIVAQTVRDWITRGRAFVLSVADEAALRSAFGTDFASYMSHAAAIITINTPPAKQFT